MTTFDDEDDDETGVDQLDLFARAGETPGDREGDSQEFSARSKLPDFSAFADPVTPSLTDTRKGRKTGGAPALDFSGQGDEITVPKSPPLPRARPADAPQAETIPLPTPRPDIGSPADPDYVGELQDAPFRSGGSVLDAVFGTDAGMLTGDEAHKERADRIAAAEQALPGAKAELETAQKRYNELLAGVTLTGEAGDVMVKNEFRRRAGLGKAEANFKAAQDELTAVNKSGAPTEGYWRDKAERVVPSTVGIVTDTARGGARLATGAIAGANAVIGKLLGTQAGAAGDMTGPVDKALDEAANNIKTYVGQRLFKSDTTRDKELGAQLVQGITSTAVFAATGGAARLAGLSVPAAVAIAGALPQGEQQYQQAEAAARLMPGYARAWIKDKGLDLTEEQANDLVKWTMFVSGLGIGATEAVPIAHMFQRIDGATKGGLKAYLGVVGAQAGEEGLQEGLQQLLQNSATQNLLDPNQKVTEGVGTNMLVGALSGALITGIVAAPSAIRGDVDRVRVALGDEVQPEAPPTDDTNPPGPPGAPPPAPLVDPEKLPVVPVDAVSAIERRILRKKGYQDDQIDTMGRAEIEDEIGEAAQQGIEPEAETAAAPAPLAPDVPSAEPVSDLKAQAADLADPKNPRQAVWVPASSVERLSALGHLDDLGAAGDRAVPDFDGQGGLLVARDEATAQQAVTERDSGVDPQVIIGRLTGSGEGKPTDGAFVVQQIDKDGNVTRERLVRKDEVAAIKKEFAAKGRKVRVVSPADALNRRNDLIAKEDAAVKPDFSDQGTAAEGHGTRVSPAKVNDAVDVTRAAGQVNTEPSEAQKDAGNYKKGHIKWNGLDITIENPQGSIRTGVDATTKKPWKSQVNAHYGYVKRTTGKDGDQVDVFLGEHTSDPNKPVFVIDQYDKRTGKFDEHKVMLGFDQQGQATNAYELSYNDDAPNDGRAMTQLTLKQFKKWLKSGNLKAPIYKQGIGDVRWSPIADHEPAVLDAIKAAGIKPESIDQEFIDDATMLVATEGMDPVDALEQATLNKSLRDGTITEAEAKAIYGEEPTDDVSSERASGDVEAPAQESGASAAQPAEGDVREGQLVSGAGEARQEDQADQGNRPDFSDQADDAAEDTGRTEGADATLAAAVDLDDEGHPTDPLDIAVRTLANNTDKKKAPAEILKSRSLVKELADAGYVQGAKLVLTEAGKARSHAIWDAMLEFQRDPIAEKLIKSGLMSTYQNTLHDKNPRIKNSRLFSYPLAYSFEPKGKKSSLYLSHPKLADEAFVKKVEKASGLKAKYSAEPKINGITSGGPHGQYHHAVDLATNEDWKSLAETVEFIGPKELYGGIAYGVQYGKLSPENARKLLKAADANDELPKEEVIDTLAHASLSKLSDKTENVLFDDDASLHNRMWAQIVGHEDGYLKIKKGFTVPTDKLRELIKNPPPPLPPVGEDEGGASAKVQAADSDEFVNVKLTEKGPWDFNDTFPAVQNLELWETTGNEPDNVEAVAGMLDETLNGMMSDFATMRSAGRLLQKARAGEKPPKKRMKPEAWIKELERDIAQARESFVNTASEVADMFGADAASAMKVEARRRIVQEGGSIEQSDEADANALDKQRTSTPFVETAIDKANDETKAARIEDAGEKIGGARKDQWTGGLGVDDLESMNGAERAKNITKEKVWPRPDYAALVEDGVDPKAAFLIKRIYDKLPTTPQGKNIGLDEQTQYISILNVIRRALSTVKTAADVEGLYSKVNEEISGAPGRWSTEDFNTVVRHEGPGRWRHPTELTSRDRRAAEKAVAAGFPNTEPWQRFYVISQQPKWQDGKVVGDEFYAYGRKRGSLGPFVTRDEAVAAAKAAYEKNKGRDDSKGEEPKRPHLDNVRRVGPDIRQGKDVGSEDFIKDFGFRGVEFGNWVANDERQKTVNLAYDALHDLARIFDVPPKAISLNGTMGLSFGGRGHGGKAAAHYEASRLVINMTKISGAGTLAHEWGHALDHYLGEQDSQSAYGGAPKSISNWRDITVKETTYPGRKLGDLPPRLNRAANDLMQALHFKPETDEQQQARIGQSEERSTSGIKSWEEEAERVKNLMRKPDANKRGLAARLRKAEDQIEVWKRHMERRRRAMATKALVATDYFKEAQKLSGTGDYWRRPNEMFARAFEAYVYDRLAGEGDGHVSQYLVQGVEPDRFGNGYKGNPYPAGEERAAINNAFDEFVKALQVTQGKHGDASKIAGKTFEDWKTPVITEVWASPQVEEITDKEKFAGLEDEMKALADETAAMESGKKKVNRTAMLAAKFAEHLRDGGEFGNILAARKMAKEAGFDGDAKAVEEAMELAVVQLAREIAADRADPKANFTALVDLYSRQPKLGTRTSTSMREQAFSTPVPLAFVASRLAGITPETTVLEPTAGNGALLIEASSTHAVANEINPARAENLKSQGFLAVTAKDALDQERRPGFDVVIANPPFGAVRQEDESKVFDLSDVQKGYKTKDIDHAIALRALQGMKDDGRAVLLLGGLNKMQATPEARSDGYNGKSKREFYKTLYDRYNVTDHFTVAGELYERQGAGWPVDVVVIDGRGKSERSLPAVDVPRVLDSWGQIGELLDALSGRSDQQAERPAARNPVEGRPGERDVGVRNQGERVSEFEPETRQPGIVQPGSDERASAADREGQGPAGTERGNAERAGGEPDAERRPSGIEGFDEAFDQALDTTFGPQAGPKTSQAPRARSTGQVAKSAVRHVAGSADDAMAGLVALFGGGKSVSSGLSFDPETYAKAKPLFTQAAQKFVAFKDDVAELVKRMVGEMQRLHGLTRDALEAMRPYLRRFMQDLQAGAINLTGQKAAAEKPAKIAASTATAEQETGTQVIYTPKSGQDGLGTLVPVNMRTSVNESLADLEKRVGDLDQYVSDQLGYEPDELGDYFAAEQVDALALAIDNLDRGKGFIIGDQTGIGKGRVNAAIIRWAIKKGRIPVFVTEKPNLYRDMYRDLNDIGISNDFLDGPPRILATNSDLTVPMTEDGDITLKTGSSSDHSKLLGGMTVGKFGQHYDMVFTTYSQMQTVAGKDTTRRAFLTGIAPSAVLIFDESHNAGGQGQKGWKPKNGTPSNRSGFARDLVKSANGVFYSSATYAKRPDVMDLYSATDMVMAVEKVEDLAEAIARGGVPMQQVVASMLAKAGQYIRRERSFAGVTYATPIVNVNHDQYDGISRSLAEIQDFSVLVADAARQMDAEIKAQAEAISGDNATGGAGASSVLFTSIMHNIINQMLLAMKSAPAVERAIAAIKRGQKPVITVANTMESFLSDFAEAAGIEHDDVMNADFSRVLQKYLDRTRTLIIKKPFAEKESDRVRRHYLSNGELGASGVAAYNRAKEAIDALVLTDLPVSPIDHIKQGLVDAGYKVGEITGRGTILDYSGDEPVLRGRSTKETSIRGRINTISQFNSGDLDAILLNQAGATGLSLHASKTFKDQRKRHMMIAQAEANIDTHMQILGRVHRTGQVELPEYSQLVADIPAEKRPAAVLAKKMASLNANTTASRGGALTSKDVPDFINEYGDMVAATIIADDPVLNARLGNPVKIDENGKIEVEDAMRRLTGRIPLLPLKEQEELYERLEADYAALLEQMQASGENALEAQTLDLKARPLERTEVQPAKSGSTSPFAAAVFMEKTSIMRLGKPFSAMELMNKLSEQLDTDGDHVGGNIEAHVPQEEADGNAATMLADIIDQYGLRGKIAFERNREAREAADSDFATYRREILDDIETPEKQEKERNKLNAVRDRWAALHEMLPTGARITLKTNSGNIPAIVIKVDRTGETKNPLALSSWKVQFAVADAARQVTLPFSRLYQDGKSPAEDKAAMELRQVGWNETAAQTIARFAEMQNSARDERYIATGNLLAAYDWLGMKGRIINYTDEAGHIRQGILTAKEFDLLEHFGAKARPIRDPAEVFKWLKDNRGKVMWSQDDVVRLMLDHARLYITTEAAKRTGGVYYLDKNLTDITRDFYKRGPTMTNDIYDPKDSVVLDIIKRLQDLGAVFVDKNEVKLPPAEKLAEGDKASISGRLTETPAFKKWFGNSKAVDAEGRPQVVYHGTNSNFDRFSKEKLGAATGARSAKMGFFFTDNADLASSYADNENPYDGGAIGKLNKAVGGRYQPFNEAILRVLGRSSILPTGQNVKPVYLSLQNPLEVDFDGEEASSDRPYSSVIERAKEAGHDGLIIRGTVDPGFSSYPGPGNRGGMFQPSDLFIAFEPTQIKSAIGNRGTFDPNNDDLLASAGRTRSTQKAIEGFQLTRRAEKSKRQIEDAVREAIRQVAGRSVAARANITDFIDGRPNSAWGSDAQDYDLVGLYSPSRDLVSVALVDNPDAVATGYHEGWHAIEGTLTQDEIDILRRETDRLRSYVTRRQPDLAEIIGTVQPEEIWAEAAAQYANAKTNGEPIGGIHIAVRRIFEKIMRLLAQIKNALNGMGFQSAEDIFESFARGEMAERRSGLPDDMRARWWEPQAQGERASVRRRDARPGDLIPPPETTREAWDQDKPFKERLSDAFDALLLTPARAMWDRQIDLLRFQKSSEAMRGAVGESLDTYLAATLYPGKVGERMKDAVKALFEPLYDAMRDQGVARDELHEYLYARHAAERNAKIREIDPDNDAGSGMTDEEAAEVLGSFVDRKAEFEAVAALVDRIVAANRNVILREGLETEATVDNWANAYQHYVPLKGFEAGTDDELPGSPSSGRGFDVRRPESQRALGRFDRADDILANLLDQTQRTIIRAEKNRVAKTFLRFAQGNPSPFYKIGLAETKRRISPETGLVEEYHVNLPTHLDRVFAAKVGGKTHYIEIKHAGLLEALKTLGADKMNPFFRLMARLTREYSRFQTGKNPEFVFTNLVRDLQDATFTISAEQQKKYTRRFLANIANGKALYGAILGVAEKGEKSPYRRWFEEWREAGGKISHYGLKDLETLRDEIDKELNLRTETTGKQVAMAAPRFLNPINGKFVKFLEALSDVTESTTRLAIYISGREIGLTKAQAAKMSRNATVDFNRRGKYGSVLGALYAFANANIQGNIRLLRVLRKSKIARRAAMGLVVAGMLMTLWNMAVSPEDAEKMRGYEKRKYWERERNIIIYMPGSKYAAKIPLGYGLNVFWMMGEQLAMRMLGKVKTTEAIGNVMGTMVDAFNPTGSQGSFFDLATWAKALFPTVLRPVPELALNKNWAGNRIHPDPMPWTDGIPPSSQHKSFTSPVAIGVAEMLNKLTGGNKFEPGMLSAYPDDVEYMFNFATGGLGRFMLNTAGTINDAVDGVDRPPDRIPFVRRFVASDNSPTVDQGAYYDKRHDEQVKARRLRSAIKARSSGEDDGSADDVIERLGGQTGARPSKNGKGISVPSETIFRNTDKQIKALRLEEDAIRKDPKISRADRETQIRALREQMREIMGNARVAVPQPAAPQ